MLDWRVWLNDAQARHQAQVIEERKQAEVRAMLEELKTQPGLSLESRADLDQIRLADGMSADDWMRRYYEQR